MPVLFCFMYNYNNNTDIIIIIIIIILIMIPDPAALRGYSGWQLDFGIGDSPKHF